MAAGTSRLVSTNEACTIIGISTYLFYKHFAKQLTPIKKKGEGKTCYYPETDILRIRDQVASHRGRALEPPAASSIPMETYVRIIADLEAGKSIIEAVCTHGVYLSEANKLYREYLLLKRSMILDDAQLTDLWDHLYKRFGETRHDGDAPDRFVTLFKKLADEASVEDAQRACHCCPSLAQRRATLCEVCAEDKFRKGAAPKGRHKAA